MQNARKYDASITVGAVPGQEDLVQLQGLGYRTLVDVRDEHERFGGAVEKSAGKLGLRYTNILAAREAIRTGDVRLFYETVFDPGATPVYAFSRYGKRPLAFLLIFDALRTGRTIHAIFSAAMRFGLSLDGDLTLRAFVVNALNSGELRPIVDGIVERWPELARRETPLSSAPPRQGDEDEVQTALGEALQIWATTRDREALRKLLGNLCRLLEP